MKVDVDSIPKPISKRQHMYVTTKTDITLFGGAAGSGKSEIGVIDLLQYVMIPNFIAVVTRRTTPQLKGAGGIFSKCMRTFKKVFKYKEDFIWKDKENKFVFFKVTKDESGKIVSQEQVSEVFLKHFEHEKDEDNWQGIEANLFLVDEGCQFTIGQIQYIMSRMRNPSCPEVEPKLKITCNPDADHPFATWVAPYLNEDGTPDRSKDGMVRYFTYNDGDFCWGDTIEEVVYKAQCDEKDVLSFSFISANVTDNKIVQEINPKYVSWLKGLRGVEKQRLLYGNWRVRESASSLWQRIWCQEIHEEPPFVDFIKIVRAWDFADKLPSDKDPSPDYTVSMKMGKLRTGEYVILDVTRHRVRTGGWVSHILEMASKDGKYVDILIPQDPGVMAKLGMQDILRGVTDAGYYAIFKATNKKKLERFRPFAAASHNGNVMIMKNCGTDFWNKIYNDNNFWFKELEVFTGERKRGEDFHDDVCDTASDCFMYLATQSVLPTGFLSGMKSFDTSNKSPLLNIK